MASEPTMHPIILYMLHCLAAVCDPPCVNGVCVQNNNCSCSEGYSGNTCADPAVGECEEDISFKFCKKGETCVIEGVSAVCKANSVTNPGI